jgi:hypothetical protein
LGVNTSYKKKVVSVFITFAVLQISEDNSADETMSMEDEQVEEALDERERL